MGMEHIHYVYWLSCIKGTGSVKRNRLLGYFGSEEEIYAASDKQLLGIKGIGSKDVFSIMSGRDSGRIEEEYGKMLSKGIKFTYKGHNAYPYKLENIYDAPYSLFIKAGFQIAAGRLWQWQVHVMFHIVEALYHVN